MRASRRYQHLTLLNSATPPVGSVVRTVCRRRIKRRPTEDLTGLPLCPRCRAKAGKTVTIRVEFIDSLAGWAE